MASVFARLLGPSHAPFVPSYSIYLFFLELATQNRQWRRALDTVWTTGAGELTAVYSYNIVRRAARMTKFERDLDELKRPCNRRYKWVVV